MSEDASVYIRIVLAKEKGVGMRLSVDEVQKLGNDWAIYNAAYYEAVRNGWCGECYRKRCKCKASNER